MPAAPDSLFAHLNPAHPRLMITETALQSIRDQEKGDASVQEALHYLRKRADSLQGIPPCAYRLASGGSLLQTSREVLERILLLGFLANLDRSAKYADRALRELDSASRFPDWGPTRFLDVAEMAAAFAVGYDWLYSRATPAQRSAILQAIKSKAFDPAAAEYDQRKWWVDSKSNWNAVCNSAMAMAALASGNDMPAAKSLLHRSLLSLQGSGALNAYAPDGAYAEGIGYWCFSTQYLSMLFASLQTGLGDEFGLSRLPGMAETGLFPIYSEGPTGRMVNFGDASDGPIYPYWMSGFALNFKQPLYAWFAQKHSGLHVFDVLWYDKAARNAGPALLPLSKRFRGSELAVFKSAWGDSNASYLAFKSGNPASEHSHLDVGSFTFEALGKRWAVDLGPDRYGLPGYFLDYDDSVSRYTYYRVRAEGHNTLTLNPGMAPDQELSPSSTLVRFDAAQQVAVGDLTSAYAKHAVKVLRGVSLQAGGRAMLQDEMELRAPGEVWWRMHTEAAITVEPGGRSAMLAQGGKRVWVSLLGPVDGMVFSSLKAGPLPGTPKPAGQDPNAGVSVLAVHLTQIRQARIIVWMVPLREGESRPAVLPSVEPLGILAGAGEKSAVGFHWNADGLNVELSETGPFQLKLFSARGGLLRELQGMAPGRFDVNPGKAAQGPLLVDFRMENVRKSMVLPGIVTVP